jgi:predicted site-specific integrase-resolvase
VPQTAAGLLVFLTFLLHWVYAGLIRTLLFTSLYQLLIPEKQVDYRLETSRLKRVILYDFTFSSAELVGALELSEKS